MAMPAVVLVSRLLADGENLSIFEPTGEPAGAIRGFFVLALAIVGVIFLLVQGALLYCLIRFRGRPNAPAAEPPQIYGSKPIEVAWTVAPVLIVFVLFLVVMRSVAQVRLGDPQHGDVDVQVIGHQWWWEFRYPGLDVVTANELHVPVGRRVPLELYSADVIHSFWVPRLSGKMDLIPGRHNRMWLRANEPETFYGQCAEYCGAQHANMIILVIAESQEDFDRWVEEQRRPPREVPSVRAGRTRFFELGCMNCHRIGDTRARGDVGPDLTHLMSRQTLASGMIPNDADNLTAWMRDPQKIKPGCKMPNMQLSERDVTSIVAFLRTLQ
jgi:cytochrome c oxidase subunit 2